MDDSEGSPPPQAGDNQALSPAQLLHSYLVYIRLSKTIDRYLLMIDQLRSGTSSSGEDSQKSQRPSDAPADASTESSNQEGKQKGKRKKQKEDAAAALLSQQAGEKSKAKPLDLVRLYDTVLQVRWFFPNY